MIRRMIRNSPVLYPLYLKYLLRTEVEFPSAETRLHLTGFPRSANTTCMHLLHTAFPEMSIVTHIHTTASIKIALRLNVPTLVLVRDPIATCCSWLIALRRTADSREIGRLLKDYIEYHRFVLKNRKKLRVLRFEDVVQSPEYVIRAVVDYLGLTREEAEIREKAEAGLRCVEEKEAKKKVEFSALPNETREQMKAEIEPHVRNHPLSATALKLHADLQLERD